MYIYWNYILCSKNKFILFYYIQILLHYYWTDHLMIQKLKI